MVDQKALIHEAVIAIARAVPEKTAVICGTVRLSYAELDRRSDAIAAALADHVREPGRVVAVQMRRSVDQVAALLGVLKAGGAFLPMEPSVPAAWRDELLADSGAAAILVDGAGDGAESAVPTVPVADVIARGAPAHPTLCRPAADDPAYVIYTSGSTGRPKGVIVEHRNVLRLFTACRPLVGFDADSIWSVFHSFSFDFSVWELWGALLHGGTAVLIPDGATTDFAQVARIVADERVTLLSMTPSNFSLFSRCCIDSERALPHLRTVVFGGERLDQAHLRDWHARYGDSADLVNMYGITEITVHATFRRLTAQDIAGDSPLPIGKPLPDLSIFLVDAQGAPVARGEVGEMAIAGPGVARGYLNRDELTRERFPTLPLGSGAPLRVYLSGDYAVEENGELLYRGRRDDQVKVRGYRVELGQVEAQLMRLEGVERCAVAKQPIDDSDSRLVAFLVPGRDWRGTAAAKAALEDAMPAYMVPSTLVEVASLPVSVNGKVDRQALLAGLDAPPAAGAADPREAAVETVAQLAREILRIPDLSVEEDLFDQGATSLSLVRLLLSVNSKMGASIVGSDLDGDSSIRNIARLARPASTRDDAGSAATEAVAQLARDILRIPDLSVEEDLFDQGATSLSLVRLLLAVNNRFGAAIAGPELDGDTSVVNIARLAFAAKQGGKPLALAS